MFMGEYNHTIDAKGRLIIPAKFREPLGEEFVLTRGDIQVRKNTNASIAEGLVNTFAPLVLNSLMMIFYLVVMIRYSPVLTLMGVTSVFLNLLLSNIISKKKGKHCPCPAEKCRQTCRSSRGWY